MMGRLSIVILDEATSALNSGNEASLYERLRDSGATLISIAHRPAVLRHHTHALQLMGEGAWAVHEESAYQFEGRRIHRAVAVPVHSRRKRLGGRPQGR